MDVGDQTGANYKERYYTEKFKIYPKEFPGLRKGLTVAYIQGLIWNFHYYYKGYLVS